MDDFGDSDRLSHLNADYLSFEQYLRGLWRGVEASSRNRVVELYHQLVLANDWSGVWGIADWGGDSMVGYVVPLSDAPDI